jgi:lipoate-protein ligase A
MARVRLIRESFPDDPALESAVAVALLSEAAAGEGALRVLRPGPAVAFGRLDALRPGFPAATAAAASHGFTPVLRAPGGHAAAFHAGCLGVELTIPDGDAITGTQARFEETGERLAGALRSLGVDARVGEVPGEYCPGRFSVNEGGRVKLIGTAQRVVRGAWLFAAMIVVTDVEPIRAVLTDVYRELGLPFDPATVGGLPATLDQVEAAVLAQYGELTEAPLPEPTLRAAREAAGRHRL